MEGKGSREPRTLEAMRKRGKNERARLNVESERGVRDGWMALGVLGAEAEKCRGGHRTCAA
jgi:hypothetical protein